MQRPQCEQTLALLVEHPRYPARLHPLEPEAERVRVRMEKGASVELWAHSAGRAPQNAYLLELVPQFELPHHRSPHAWRALCDTGGRARLDGLAPGAWEWRLWRGAELAPDAVRLVTEPLGTALKQGVLELASGRLESLEVELEQGEDLAPGHGSLRVSLQLDGVPAQGVAAQLEGARGFSFPTRWRNLSQGRARFDELPVGEFRLILFELIERPDGSTTYFASWSARFELFEGEQREFALEWRAHPLEVLVRAPDGRPVEGAQLWSQAQDPGGEGEPFGRSALTDAEGRATLVLWQPGEHELSARHDEHGLARERVLANPSGASLSLELAPEPPRSSGVLRTVPAD